MRVSCGVRLHPIAFDRRSLSHPGLYCDCIRGLFGDDRERPILINDATVSISCTEWDREELISKVNLDWSSLPAELRINREHRDLEELEWAQRKTRMSDELEPGPDGR